MMVGKQLHGKGQASALPGSFLMRTAFDPEPMPIRAGVDNSPE
jgi:hypothetical protein